MDVCGSSMRYAGALHIFEERNPERRNSDDAKFEQTKIQTPMQKNANYWGKEEDDLKM